MFHQLVNRNEDLKRVVEKGYSYSFSANATSSDYNVWTNKMVETMPDGEVHTVYTDGEGMTILDVVQSGTSGGSETWLNFYRYDSNGNLILHVNPSGFGDGDSYSESFPDLVGFGATSGSYLSASTGLFEWTDYGTASTATTTGTGSAMGYVQDTAVSEGEDGTKYYQTYNDYIESPTGQFWVADSTSYPQHVTSGSTITLSCAQLSTVSGDTMTSTYAFYSDSNQPGTLTTSSPVVTAAQNGPGTADVTTTIYDTLGRPTWTQDGNGYIDYTQYDVATGAVTKTITDVNISDTGDFSDLPSGWTTPAGGGLELVTTYQPDSLGRTIEQTDPNGNVTYTAYDDGDHAVFTFPEAKLISGDNTDGTFTTTGPASMTRDELPYTYGSGQVGTYSETLTFSGTFTVSGGLVDLPGFTGNLLNLGTSLTLQSLSRDLDNAGSQMVESDVYSNLGTSPNYTYLNFTNSSGHTGTLTVNYYATTYGYDDMGRQARTVDPNDTITDTTYDKLGRVVGTYVGTSDSIGTSNWEAFIHNVTANATDVTGTNMTLVSLNQYDDGGVGDSNLTQTTEYPGGSQPNRVTDYLYDWQDRLITTAEGIGASSSTHPPLTVNTLDNLGNVIATAQYDDQGISTLTSSGNTGVPDQLSSLTLTAYSASDYDAQGRVYKTVTYDVSPADGTYSTSPSATLVSETWYDHDGNTIAAWSSGGPMTEMTYDGADRVTATYTTDGGAVNNSTASGSIFMSWASANSVTHDVVLSQVEYQYDADGNVILTTDRERLPSDPSTTTGPLTNANDTSNGARVYYTLAYYDAADREIESVNVGTNGGISNDTSAGGVNLNITSGIASRPSTMPNRTVNTDTQITIYTYNAAGEQATVTDPNGLVTQSVYDLLGNQVESIVNNSTVNGGTPSTTNTATNVTTLYTYDGDGNLTSETALSPLTETAQSVQTTVYVYNFANATALGISTTSAIYSNDLLWATENPIASGADAGQAGTTSADLVLSTYDALGDVLTTTDEDGNKHTYTYDALGRQVGDSVSSVLTLNDGGFESPSAGGSVINNPTGSSWTFSGNSGIAGTSSGLTGLSGYSGVQAGFLQSNTASGGTITQTISVSVGGSYEITFNTAQATSSSEVIEVLIDGNSVGTFNATSSTFTSFTTDPFTINVGQHTLTLETVSPLTGTNTTFVDQVSLAAGAFHRFHSGQRPRFGI